MLINADRFPQVWIRLLDDGQSLEAGFEVYRQLLDRGRPFVLLNDEGLDFSGRQQDKDEMQYVAQWRKTERVRLRQLVPGAVFIEPDAALRAAAQDFAVSYGKFWGYPMLIVASREEALALAERLLTGQG